jgi:hypothetical protein
MSDQDFQNEVADLTERFLLYLRGQGPMPDLGHLDAGQRAEVRQRFELLDVIADRPVGPPPRSQDPVAAMLGLVSPDEAGERDPGDTPDGADPVRAILDSVERTFGTEVALFWDTSWMINWLSDDLTPVAQCNVLGIPMAIFSCDDLADPEVGEEPVEIGRFLRQNPDITAVALVTRDASRAVVLNDASCHPAIDPASGWVPPGAYVTPGPFDLELQRFLESRLPRWDAVDGLERFRGIADVHADAATATAEALAAALRMKPRLSHKQLGQASLRDISVGGLTDLVAETQAGGIEPTDLVDRVLALGEAAT